MMNEGRLVPCPITDMTSSHNPSPSLSTRVLRITKRDRKFVRSRLLVEGIIDFHSLNRDLCIVAPVDAPQQLIFALPWLCEGDSVVLFRILF